MSKPKKPETLDEAITAKLDAPPASLEEAMAKVQEDREDAATSPDFFMAQARARSFMPFTRDELIEFVRDVSRQHPDSRTVGDTARELLAKLGA